MCLSIAGANGNIPHVIDVFIAERHLLLHKLPAGLLTGVLSGEYGVHTGKLDCLADAYFENAGKGSRDCAGTRHVAFRYLPKKEDGGLNPPSSGRLFRLLLFIPVLNEVLKFVYTLCYFVLIHLP